MKMNPTPSQPVGKSVCETFQELCEHLIEEEGHNYLYPVVSRTRSTDWMVHVFDHHDKERQTLLAQGQAQTMEEAIMDCVRDHAERERIAARKEELLQMPHVTEALELFGVKPKETK